MKSQCLTSGTMNTLPENIVDHLLTLMPIRDALRTSILSKKWRYRWTSMPKLAFDYNHVRVPCDCKKLEIYKLVNAILHVLLLHKGPLVKFEFSARGIHIGSEFDPIILYLSRINKIKFLIFVFPYGYKYKLPHSFFSLIGLEVLELHNCDFDPPLTFNGLGKLWKVILGGVEIKAKMFLPFLANCPSLQKLRLIGRQGNFEGGNEFTFVELLACVPLVKTLDISKFYMKHLVVAPIPHKLSTSLVHLKNLYLDVCLMDQDEICCALSLIRSSPILERIIFLMYDNDEPHGQPTPMNFFDPRDYSDLYLDHLEKLEIQMFRFLALEMEFVKLIMAKSPVLKKVLLEIDNDLSVDEELIMLRGLIQSPFPHASPVAKLIIKRPKA